MSIAPFVVIGGGAAGLSAAIKLSQLKNDVILLEKNDFAIPRMCGEFLSSECLTVLQNWGIKPACSIKQIHFNHHNGKSVKLALTPAAASMPRINLEKSLVNIATQQGVELRTQQSVTEIRQHSAGYIELIMQNQAPIKTHRVIVSAGRYYQQAYQPEFLYTGRKAHFRGTNLPDCLEMYVTAEGYFGIVPVSETEINVALLTDINHPIPKSFSQRLSAWQQVDDWIEGQVPAFGLKPWLNIPGVYTVGDAAASIPPITGDGVGMALTSGILVAEMAARGNWKQYQQQWREEFLPRINWGKFLHRIAMLPTYSSLLMSVVKKFPALGTYLYKNTRG